MNNKNEEAISMRFTERSSTQKIKLFLFNLTNDMLQHQTFSTLKYIVLSFVCSSQLLFYCFHHLYKDVWNNSIFYKILSVISNVVHLSPLLEYTSWSLHLVIFYMVCFVLLSTFVLSFYTQSTTEKSAAISVWSLKILCIWTTLLQSIMYMPTLGTLISIVDCQTENGELVHIYHSEVKCFAGQHWIHVIFAAFFFILTVSFSMLLSLLFYETRMKSPDVTSRNSSYYEIWEIAYKTGLGIMVLFIKWNGGQWLLCLYMCIGAGLLYVSYANKRRFFSDSAFKTCRFFALIHFWFAIAFGYAFLLKSYKNTGAAEAMILCMPLLASVIIMSRDSDWETLLVNNITVLTPEDYLKKINAYLVLALDKEHERFGAQILKGYGILHVQLCQNENCALKQFIKQDITLGTTATNKRKANNRKREKERKETNKKDQDLLSHANELFIDAIARFPKSNSLRLAYSLFLIELLNNQSEALEELAMVEQRNPSFEEQRQIFRYKQMIKKDLLENKKNESEKVNMSSVMAYESHSSLFKEKIEKTAVLHVQFWSMLLDDAPDLTKLKELGHKIEQYVEEVEFHWEQMQELDPDELKDLKMYALFVEHILNDKENGKSLANRANECGLKKLNINKRKIQAANTSDLQVIASEGDPCICISGQQSKLGIITQCNMALCRILGYSKKELIGNNVSILMPELIAVHHQEVLMREMQASLHNKAKDITKKEIKIFTKTKAGYIIPAWLSLLSRPTLLNDSSYIAILRIEKLSIGANILYLILDTKQCVTHMSSSSILICGLYNYMARFAKIHISLLCPELDLREALMVKADIKTNLYLPIIRNFEGADHQDEVKGSSPTGHMDSVTPNEDSELLRRGKSFIAVNCRIDALEMSGTGLVGYSVQLELNDRIDRVSLSNQLARPNFQFRFDGDQGLYIREFAKDPEKGFAQPTNRSLRIGRSSSMDLNKVPSEREKQARSKMYEAQEEQLSSKEYLQKFAQNLDAQSSSFFKAIAPRIAQISEFITLEPSSPSNIALNDNLANLLRSRKVDYGTEVRTLRLIKGNFEEVEEQPLQVAINTNAAPAEYEATESTGHEKSRNNKTAFLIANNIKGRKSLEAAITQGTLTEFKCIAANSYLLLCVLFTLSIMNYVYLTNFFDILHLHTELIDKNYQRAIHEQDLMYNVQELLLVKQQLFTKNKEYYGLERQSYYNQIQADLKEESDLLYKVQKELLKLTLKLTNYDIYSDYNTKRSINVNKKINATYIITESLSLPEVILEFLSSIFVISNENITATFDESNLYFLNSNGNDMLVFAILSSASFYMEEYEKFLNKGSPVFVWIFSVSLVFTGISIIAMLIFLHLLEKSKRKLFGLFLEVPSECIKTLYVKSEAFVNNLNYKQIDDSSSTKDSLLDDEKISESGVEQYGRFYEKRRDRKFKNEPRFAKKLFIGFVVSMAVLCSIFVSEYSIYVEYKNRALRMLPAFNHITRLTGPLFLTLNAQRSYIYDPKMIIDGSLIHDFLVSYINISYERTRDIERVKESMKEIVDTTSLQEVDYLLYDNLCTRTTYFASTSQCAAFAQGSAQEGITVLFSHVFVNTRIIVEDIEKNNGTNKAALFNSELLYESYVSIEKIIRPMLQKVQQYILDGVEKTYKGVTTTRLGLLIGYLILISIITIFAWRPFISFLESNDLKARKMLVILPLELMLKVKHINKYLESKIIQTQQNT